METPFCTASLCLHGGHLTSWIPPGEDEVLFVSSQSEFVPGKAIRGGIPICWPWFGSKEGRPSAHGYARTSLWAVVSCREEEEDVVIVLSLKAESDDQPCSELTFRLGRKLHMALETRAGSQPCSLTEAMHTYFKIGDVRKCSVKGLEGVPFVECAGGGHVDGMSSSAIVPDGEIDRVYTLPSDSGMVTIEDASLHRVIEVYRKESGSMIVWNPWEAGTKSKADMSHDDWGKFICVEVANNSPSEVILCAGGVHTMSQVIGICPL